MPADPQDVDWWAGMIFLIGLLLIGLGVAFIWGWSQAAFAIGITLVLIAIGHANAS